MAYTPPQKILEKYADLLVNFALWGGDGIRKGDTVYLVAEESAKPLFVELRKAIWKAGGHVIANYTPSDTKEFSIQKDFFTHANDEQINFLPEDYFKGLIDQIDHQIYISSPTDKHALKGIDPKKIMARGKALHPVMEWRSIKENKGNFTWTIGLYGTEAMAQEAGMSLEKYWEQIINACYLDEKEPIKKWKELYKKIESYKNKLNKLQIDELHIEGKDVDLWITIGEKRAWMGGGGRNIPSFEIFTSPDWRGTNGWIKFNQPLYRYGNRIEGIELEFKRGKVVKSKAKKNEKLLQQMIATPGADKVGEFSLTDKRFSRITKFMAETLFDENMGGEHGNTHIALGMSYHDCYSGDPSRVKNDQWKKLGYNESSVHTDIVSTSPRIVTAHLANGKTKVIYKDGEFVL